MKTLYKIGFILLVAFCLFLLYANSMLISRVDTAAASNNSAAKINIASEFSEGNITIYSTKPSQPVKSMRTVVEKFDNYTVNIVYDNKIESNYVSSSGSYVGHYNNLAFQLACYLYYNNNEDKLFVRILEILQDVHPQFYYSSPVHENESLASIIKKFKSNPESIKHILQYNSSRWSRLLNILDENNFPETIKLEGSEG